MSFGSDKLLAPKNKHLDKIQNPTIEDAITYHSMTNDSCDRYPGSSFPYPGLEIQQSYPPQYCSDHTIANDQGSRNKRKAPK